MKDNQILSWQSTHYRQNRIRFWDQVASQKRIHGIASAVYYRRLQEIYRFHIPPGLRVIEIGCGEGDLLSSICPDYGLGVDFSSNMIERAQKLHPELDFMVADGLEFTSKETFDIVILSDLINDIWDVQTLFERVHSYCHAGTRVVFNFYSRLWTPLLSGAELLGLAQKPLEQSWLTKEDVNNLLNLTAFETIFTSNEILFPLPLPLINQFCNQFLVRIWPFNLFALTNLFIVRPRPGSIQDQKFMRHSISVIIPARNEAGNIQNVFERMPKLGGPTELIFVEGNSTDDTYQEIERQIKLHSTMKSKLVKQIGKGKGDAVRLGFQHAMGEVLIILDADLSVPPEYLPRFYKAISSRAGEFINGVRLVYPMEKQAMRLANFIGNKAFSLAFGWLIGQSVKDTLCGTKAIFREDYLRIARNRSYFGDFDPFGDFDLLFGAAKLNLKIADIPIRYQERSYGSTNIQRWKHGWLLLKMVFFAAFRLKFI